MKRVLLTAGLLLLTLGALAFPAAAQEDSASLAQHFPGETAFYLEFRTDDAQLAMVDDLIDRINTAVGERGAPTMTEMLNLELDRMEDGATFENTIRPWLGEMAALGITRFDEEAFESPAPPVLIAIEITDAVAAEKFFTVNAPLGEYTVERGEDATIYLPPEGEDDDPYLIFQSDLLIIGALSASGEIMPAGATLNDNPDFITALDLLPAESYSATLYMDTPAILDAMLSEQGGMSATELAMVTPMLNAVKPQALGITMLDENTVAIDAASPVDLEAMSAFSPVIADAIDPAFARHIPANTPLVVHGANLYGNYQAGLNSLRSLSEMMRESGEFDGEDIETALFGLNFLVRGLTGMETDEAIGWMTGDYAFAVSLAPAAADANSLMALTTALPVDFGMVVEVTDEDAAQALYDGLSLSLSGLPAEDVSVTEELLFNDVSALVITITSDETPFPVELLVATGNDVFAFGTRRMVSAAIEATNGLDTDATYSAASERVLDGANAVLYFNAEGLQPIVRLLRSEENGRAFQRDAEQLDMALTLVNTVTISSAVLPEQNASLSRLVWTLAD